MNERREKAIEAATEAFANDHDPYEGCSSRSMRLAIDAYEAAMRQPVDVVYQSQKPCLKCGSVERYIKTRNCVPCARRLAREYQRKNLEYCRQSARDRQRQRTEDKRNANNG